MMKYQLVIQLPEALYGDLDWIAELEEQVNKSIVDAEVDGHDMGSGEVNVFIHANNPVITFQIAKNILQESGVEPQYIKAVDHAVGEDNYILLWPENLANFNVL